MDLLLKKSLDQLAIGCLTMATKMHRSDLLNDIRDLWRALTVDRAVKVNDYFQKAPARRAYIGYYFPMYVAKIAALLSRLKAEGRFDALNGKPLQVLDLGSGTLTGLTALKLAFGSDQFKGHAVDKSLAPMKLGLDVLSQVFKEDFRQTLTLKQANLLGPKNLYLPKWKPNFIFLGHVLNELGEGQRALPQKIELVTELLEYLEPGGMLLAVEPATRGPTRDLMALRDALNQEEGLRIVAPCTGASECPLLKTATSWCFCELKWQRPKEFQRIDETIGFERDLLKTSYLLVEKGESSKVTKHEARVVSGAMSHAGVLRRYLCTPNGLRTLETRNSSTSAHLVQKTLRGELLSDVLSRAKDVKIHKEV